jgi:hypothetical protein
VVSTPADDQPRQGGPGQRPGEREVGAQITLPHRHLLCFNDDGLVPFEEGKKNSTVLGDFLKQEENRELLQSCVSECLALTKTEVHDGVQNFLNRLTGLLRRATLFKSLKEKEEEIVIGRIAAKMLQFNQENSSAFLSLANSCLFRGFSRCVVFAGDLANDGLVRLLGYFRMQEPQTEPAELKSLVLGRGDSDWPLVILDSESGNGKTTACIWLSSEVSDVKHDTRSLRCVLLVVLNTDAEASQSHENRQKVLQERLGDLLQAQLGRLETDVERDGFKQATWFVAFDEVSRIPNFLQTLCTSRIAIADYLRERFKFVNSVRILAAGTGSTGAIAPGCCPTHYKVVTLWGQTEIPPKKDCSPKKFRSHLHSNHVDRFDRVATWELWNAMMHIPFIEQAVENPRFAECLMEQCGNITENLGMTHPVAITRAMIDTVIELSCIRFKELNACSGLDRHHMMQVVADAIQYAIVPKLATKLPPGFATYGMGRDVAEARFRSAFASGTGVEVKTDAPMRVSRGFDENGIEQYEDLVLVVPEECNRFSVSERQWSLLALGYGRGEPQPDWDDFWQAAALFVRLNMIGLQGETVWQALLTLRGRSTGESPFDGHYNMWLCEDAAIQAAAVERTLSYTRLVCWTETTKVEKSTLMFNPTFSRSEDEEEDKEEVLAEAEDSDLDQLRESSFDAEGQELLQRLEAVLIANHGAVIVNAPYARFADIIFLSRELVILIILKVNSFGENSILPAEAVMEDVEALGVTSQDPWLNRFLQELFSAIGTPLPLVISAIMTTNTAVDLTTEIAKYPATSDFPLVLQWTVTDGFVDESKVRFRFPEPAKATTQSEATIINTAAVLEGDPEPTDFLRPHFRLGPVL